MRKVKDSAAVALDSVDMGKAVDLSSEKVLAQVRRRAKLTAAKPTVIRERVRIEQRINFLQRKAARMPLGNGRRKVEVEIDQLLETAHMLSNAAEGKKPDEKDRLELTGSRHVDRALATVAVLRAA